MKNTTTRLVLTSLLIAGLAAAPALARNGGGNGQGNGQGQGQGNRGAHQQPALCDGSGLFGDGTGVCDGSGPGQGTPRRDGSGKALKNRGNPDSTGTPLKDGSGKTTAPGKGPKDGSGANPDCPNAG